MALAYANVSLVVFGLHFTGEFIQEGAPVGLSGFAQWVSGLVVGLAIMRLWSVNKDQEGEHGCGSKLCG